MAHQDLHGFVDQPHPAIAARFVGDLHGDKTSTGRHEQIQLSLTIEAGGLRHAAGLLHAVQSDGE